MSARVTASVCLSAVVLVCLTAAATAAPLSRVPRWLTTGQTQFLARVLGGAKPIQVYYLKYPRKIAVVFEFRRVVICGACSAPSNASLPRGKLIRVSFDRQTHKVLASDGLRFCEARGAYPPKSECLRR